MSLQILDRNIFETKIRPIISGLKNMKHIAILNNIAIGLNDDMGIFKIMRYLPFNMNEFNSMITISTDKIVSASIDGEYYLYDNSFICHDSLIYTIIPIEISSISHNILSKYLSITADTMSMPVVFHVDNVIEDPGFESVLSMKATDGVKYYVPEGCGNKYYMSIYSGILPFIKSDNIQLDILDSPYGSSPYFIAKFITKKKTGVMIETYIKYLKL